MLTTACTFLPSVGLNRRHTCRHTLSSSNGTAAKLHMKSSHSYHVEVLLYLPSKLTSGLRAAQQQHRPSKCYCLLSRPCRVFTPLHSLGRIFYCIFCCSALLYCCSWCEGGLYLQVVVGDDEPPENALKRFRWATKSSAIVQEVRHHV